MIMKDLRKNKPEFKPRLQPSKPVSRNPEDEGEVERTDKEKYEQELKDNADAEVQKKVGEDPRTPPFFANQVDLQNPAFDPDLPEQKQRWLR